MMEKITLSPIGDTPVTKPNLAGALDMVSIWSLQTANRAKHGRICAAVIGLCCQNLGLPRYSMLDCEPIGYGGKCLEALLGKGIWAGSIYEAGGALLVWLCSLLPQQKEVEKAENFLSNEEQGDLQE